MNQKGITLIALIITIIILVMLAVVSISTVYNMGIVNHAINGTQEYGKASKIETDTFDQVEDFIDDVLGVDKTQEYIDNAPEDAVALCKKNYYTTLQEAVDVVTLDNSQTMIVILKDISENVTIPQNTNIILELNNKTLRNNDTDTPIIYENGKLQIQNGSIIGRYSSTNKTAIYGEENSTIKVVNAEIATGLESGNTRGSAISSKGHLEISGNETRISSNSNETIYIYEGAEATITCGEISCSSNCVINNSGTLNISGESTTLQSARTGVILNYTGGTINITGGTISCSSQESGAYTINNDGNLNISGDSTNLFCNATCIKNNENANTTIEAVVSSIVDGEQCLE